MLYFLIPNDIVLIWPSYIFFDEVCFQFFFSFIKLGCFLITDFELFNILDANLLLDM